MMQARFHKSSPFSLQFWILSDVVDLKIGRKLADMLVKDQRG